MSTRVTRPPVGSLIIVQRLAWFAGFDLACALAHDLFQRLPTGTRTARGGLARRSRRVRSLGDALLPVRGGLLVLAVPGSYLKCRGNRQRRRTGHQVVRVGRVYEELLVCVTTAPLPCPHPPFIGRRDDLLVVCPSNNWQRVGMISGVSKPVPALSLTDAQREVLESLARSQSGPHREVVRAKALMMAADGASNATIAARLSVSRSTVAN